MNKLTTEQWVEKAVAKHGDKYDYSNITYTVGTDTATFICKEHGEFTQKFEKHLRGTGCEQCRVAAIKQTQAKTTEEFVTKAKEVHGSKYVYNNVQYKNNREKVQIRCRKHGIFTQSPDKHLMGRGCPECKKDTISKNMQSKPNGWGYTTWEEAGKSSPNFQGYSLYVIECSSKTTGERFIKVGKTFVGVAKRFCNAQAMPYKYKVLTEVFHNAYAISKLEDQIKSKFKDFRYLPTKEFNGQHECLDLGVKDKVIEMAEA